jgi:hypothetical protein
VAATVHCAVTYGIGPAAALKGHPVIAYGQGAIVYRHLRALHGDCGPIPSSISMPVQVRATF